MTDQTITENTVEALALAVGIRLTSDEKTALAASLRATAQDMASLDAMDLKDVEPAITFRADPQGESR
ncbi:MAG: hypothetical protein IIC24_04655 [Chloroflexi bacterium]|nr:hypothetical protein [Chloroflexota bacterium]